MKFKQRRVKLSCGSERASLCFLGGHAPQSVEIVGLLRRLKDDMPTGLADALKADEEDRKTDHAPVVQVKANEVATVTATIETNLRQGGALVKKEVATETEIREFVVLVPDPIVSAPGSVLLRRGEPFVVAVKTRHTLWCCVSLVP